MNMTIERHARQFAGSRPKCVLMISCQLGAWAVLMALTGWHYALDFGVFMVLAPSAYLWVIHGLLKEVQRNEAIKS
jgi:hypothetical protein